MVIIAVVARARVMVRTPLVMLVMAFYRRDLASFAEDTFLDVPEGSSGFGRW